jgi:DNA invertase Pin-like site-specific DNA recombinase
MLSAFAQFERSLIKERQREGIALAKAKGTVYKGRKPALSQRARTRPVAKNPTPDSFSVPFLLSEML